MKIIESVCLDNDSQGLKVIILNISCLCPPWREMMTKEHWSTKPRIYTYCCGLFVYIFKNSLFLVQANSVFLIVPWGDRYSSNMGFLLLTEVPQVPHLSKWSPNHPVTRREAREPSCLPRYVDHPSVLPGLPPQWLSDSMLHSVPCLPFHPSLPSLSHLDHCYRIIIGPLILVSCPLVMSHDHQSGLTKAYCFI